LKRKYAITRIEGAEAEKHYLLCHLRNKATRVKAWVGPWFQFSNLTHFLQ
jgi:hypothetical protein